MKDVRNLKEIIGQSSSYIYTHICTSLFVCKTDFLTHLPLVPYIYASVNRVNIGSDNALSPIRCQAIIKTNAGLLSIRPLGTYFSAI